MLFYILLLYLVVAFFVPAVGWVALICMLGPVTLSIFKGRYWCGHICPRGNFYDRVLARFSPHRRTPKWMRSKAWRLTMLGFIFTMFGVQMAASWGEWAQMGLVFWRIILITTLVAIALALIYAPRTWCMFCPMGTLSAWVAPKSRKRRQQPAFKAIHVSEACIACKRCARVCPMQLEPYEAKGAEAGLHSPDCIKCGRCVTKCPRQAMTLRHEADTPKS